MFVVGRKTLAEFFHDDLKKESGWEEQLYFCLSWDDDIFHNIGFNKCLWPKPCYILPHQRTVHNFQFS